MRPNLGVVGSPHCSTPTGVACTKILQVLVRYLPPPWKPLPLEFLIHFSFTYHEIYDHNIDDDYNDKHEHDHDKHNYAYDHGLDDNGGDDHDDADNYANIFKSNCVKELSFLIDIYIRNRVVNSESCV